jgi:FKBP-type peptidyl-prolyl cis-trans isomerase
VTIPTVVAASNSAGIPAGTVADGTRILDVTVGAGATVTRGALVTIAYKGHLLDGTIFDQKTSAQFTVDELHVIPGFAAGLIGMKVGGTRDIDISSYLAYGNGTNVGPRNSRLVFEVTVNSIP